MADEVIIHDDDPTIEIDDETAQVDVDAEASEVDIDTSGQMPSFDYRTLVHKPSINDTVLVGDKSLEDIGVDRISNKDILDIINRRRAQ